jgi:hydroxymethylbilane synthase
MMVIGSRGSALALAQTNQIKDRICSQFPDLAVSIKIIRTSADKDTTTSIRSGSSIGVFVKELEQALRKREIDIAVHSMKDLPTKLMDGLQIAAIPEREDARDALIGGGAQDLSQLPAGACVGTGSVRRQAQLLALRPDLRVKDIRGNLDTRFNKLRNGDYDAIILACAGLNRLGYQDRISTVLNYNQILPAPGQGALAIETRRDDLQATELTAFLNHAPTAVAVSAERSFLQRMGGGCNVPVAVLAEIDGDTLHINGLAATPDGRTIVRDHIQGDVGSADEAGIALADRILARGGKAILDQLH